MLNHVHKRGGAGSSSSTMKTAARMPSKLLVCQLVQVDPLPSWASNERIFSKQAPFTSADYVVKKLSIKNFKYSRRGCGSTLQLISDER